MIRQIRMLGLSVLAVFAVGVAVSASASAHAYVVCKEGGTEKFTEHLCGTKGEAGKWSWAKVEKGETIKAEDTSGTFKLEGEVAGIKVVTGCQKETFAGEIKGEGLGEGEHTLSECSVYEVDTTHESKLLTKCSVPTFSFKAASGLVSGQGFGTEVEAKELFVKVKLTGSECALKGTYDVESTKIEIGGQKFAGLVCALPEAVVGKVEHEIVCSSSGSHLTFNAKPASVASTETVKLTGGPAWAVE